MLYNPGLAERIVTKSETHIWKYGDRFYNLAHKFYGKPEFWWVIAWYNGYPTEASIKNGDVIEIPISLEDATMALGLV